MAFTVAVSRNRCVSEMSRCSCVSKSRLTDAGLAMSPVLTRERYTCPQHTGTVHVCWQTNEPGMPKGMARQETAAGEGQVRGAERTPSHGSDVVPSLATGEGGRK